VVQPLGELEDADRVEIVDRRGVRKVAHLGRVARDDDEVAHAEIVCAEEVRERGEQVPVATGEAGKPYLLVIWASVASSPAATVIRCLMAATHQSIAAT